MTMTPNMEATLQAVKDGPKEGMDLEAISKATGLTVRQVHNTTWRLEGSPKNGTRPKLEEWKLIRLNTGARVVYGIKPAGTPNTLFVGIYATRAPQAEAKEEEEKAAS